MKKEKLAMVKSDMTPYRTNGKEPLMNVGCLVKDEVVCVITRGKEQSVIRRFGGYGRDYRGARAEYLVSNDDLNFDIPQSRNKYMNVEGILIPVYLDTFEVLKLVTRRVAQCRARNKREVDFDAVSVA